MSSTLEFLQGKWRIWYQSLDVNHDGIVSRGDQDACVENVIRLYKSSLDAPSLNYLRDTYSQYWDKLIFGKAAKKDSVSEDEFVASLTKEYQVDREGLRAVASEMFNKIFTTLDDKTKTHMSFPDFYNNYSAFGHTDKPLIRLIFNAYGPNENDEIAMADEVSDFYDLVVGEDPSRHNVLLSILKESKNAAKF